ncbi:FKBP-type peptidyl-prolyl cis-trans isomerase [Musa troglodytarum]|uniref:peptidylprolyl isomerase n=2 Tax=Musa troglodytarum TaxID=320322 RepID=A0A9E7ETQ8_9LILI|nr:FKBP-type peptidyl-prolyl cis-trans isomerase [Musa troglodytarum]
MAENDLPDQDFAPTKKKKSDDESEKRSGEGQEKPVEGDQFKMKPEIHYAEEDCPVTVSDDFPKNDELHFEIEMLDFHKVKVRDMLGDGRLIKRRIVDGRGEFPMDCPLHDSLLRVHYKGMLLNEEKTVFYDTIVDNYGQPLEFRSGEGLVPEGLEMCVRLMLPGEISLVTCPPDYAYDKFTRPAIVPEGAHVQWEIELLDFEMPKGNRLFKEGKYELAKAKYEKVLREYNHVNPQDDDEGKIFLNSRNSLHLNVAACYQKMGEFRKSIETCNKVLDASPVHVKALYRRGMAYMLVGDFDEAQKDFEMMISIDKASEPDAAAALLKLKQKEQEADKKAKRQFKGLFDRNPGEIAEVGGDARDDKSPHKAEHEIENSGSEKEISKTDLDGGVTNDDDDDDDGEHEPERIGFLGRLWPSGRRILAGLGLNRCSIL